MEAAWASLKRWIAVPTGKPMSSSGKGQPRRAPRIRVAWRAHVVYQKQMLDVRVLDVSATGIGFVSPDRLRIGDEVLLKLRLPDAKNRSAFVEAILTAVVRHQRPARGAFEIGARFERIDARTLGAVRDWVESGGQAALLPKPPPTKPPKVRPGADEEDGHGHDDNGGGHEADRAS